jgi:hypothetical protein
MFRSLDYQCMQYVRNTCVRNTYVCNTYVCTQYLCTQYALPMYANSACSELVRTFKAIIFSTGIMAHVLVLPSLVH